MKRSLLKLALIVFLLMSLCAVVDIAEGSAGGWLYAALALIGTNTVCGELLKGDDNGKRKRRSA